MNDARKSISEAQFNYNSHEASKTFFLDLMMDVFEVKSEKKNSENFFFFFEIFGFKFGLNIPQVHDNMPGD